MSTAEIIYENVLTINNVNPDTLQTAYSMGMIPMSKLEVGVMYLGCCRNSSEAEWTSNNTFRYPRYSFGSVYYEEIPAPENDMGSDIFVATAKRILEFDALKK